MAKVIHISDDSQFLSKPLLKSVVAGLSAATDERVSILKKVPKKLQYHFVVNRKKLLPEWDLLYTDIKNELSVVDSDEVTLSQTTYNKLTYFAYFIGSFFKHNGSDASDTNYVEACYVFLYNTIKFVDGEEFDHTAFFKRAFL